MRLADAQYAHDHATDDHTFGSSRFICTRCILEREHEHCDACLGVLTANAWRKAGPGDESYCVHCAGAFLREDACEILDRGAIALRNAGWLQLATELFTMQATELDPHSFATRIRNTRCAHAAVDSLLAMLDALAQLQDVFDGLHRLLTDVVDTEAVQLRPLARAELISDFDRMTRAS